MPLGIEDYGIIGDLSTAGLIGKDGSIGWLCVPYFDSPSIFADILDAENGGTFRISLEKTTDFSQRYLEDTAIIETNMRSNDAVLSIVDFMVITADQQTSFPLKRGLFRRCLCKSGNAKIRVIFAPRYPYAKYSPKYEDSGSALKVEFKDLKFHLFFYPALNFDPQKEVFEFSLSQGEEACFFLPIGNEKLKDFHINPQLVHRIFNKIYTFWTNWIETNETGQILDFGPFERLMRRSAITLKLLQSKDTGAIVAAPTTSLPEQLRGARNWDYRFCWIRDAAFTVQALYQLGHLTEMENYLSWIKQLLKRDGAKGLQIMYGIRTEQTMEEQVLDHLEGFRSSGPVRIGNAAHLQRQLDIYGELMLAATHLSDYVGRIDLDFWEYLREICNYVSNTWRLPDNGIWEARLGERHYVYSKVMCWNALDKGIYIAKRYGFPGEVSLWKKEKDEIRKEVLEKGWSQEKQSFVQTYDSDKLDSSLLLLPLTGFIQFKDPKMLSTVESVVEELSSGFLLYRYLNEDGMPRGEAPFTLCTFWLVENLVGQGRLGEAQTLLFELSNMANHLGLFSEEFDYDWNMFLGNFPQALTHIGFVNSVSSFRRALAQKENSTRRSKLTSGDLKKNRKILNDGDSSYVFSSPQEIGKRLKDTMNILRGAFFKSESKRVAYEEMAFSPLYENYLDIAGALKRIDLSKLKDDSEKMPFWINLYNVMTIHGVISWGIKDSVKEISNFFRQVRYNIGGYIFCLDDIEHGILRRNKRPPWSIFRPFSYGDPRRAFMVEHLDPRIHFTLVCASSSCPPISIYSPQELDMQLDTAAMIFINSGGARLVRQERLLILSKIFKWYGADFGKTMEERLLFISKYFYDEQDRLFAQSDHSGYKVRYIPYDWRLNRI
ncbi:Glucoamylase [Dissulfuribacter thermophilus]|uniref:Glucoamylase n=1 Tax=Dissulfuribacter thermophilus TaxID=1156395 RepID=A0A1B9F2Z4_9BACT|nr:glycoside hydrolase family 15 protein [Dissulfuribacter thermophilus]OCC14290.1 Glucoamylase [Dissulfuribacter thermophilus]